jgi:MFS family permease
MGIGTALIGLVPGYSQIGLGGAILLTVLRAFQGLGIGGEWGGSVLLSLEWNGNRRRGFIGSWPQFGLPVGLVLSTGAFSLFSQILGSQFLVWGWRIPFLLSVILIGIGLYIRLGILETPVFASLVAGRRIEAAPVLEVLRRNGREVVLTALSRMAQSTTFYIFTSFVLVYGVTALGFPRQSILNATLVMAVISLFSVPLFGYLSDLVGRKRAYLIGGFGLMVFPFIYYGLLDTRVPLLVYLAIVVSLPLHDMQYGPQAALIAESFTGRLRYSGASLGYQLASVISGGPAPLIATFLVAQFHSSFPIAIYLAGTAVVSIMAALGLKDSQGRDITQEYDEVPLPAEAI